ncbi:unnamed protein product [Eruca vesicaria subsp. sativa]|uniref:Uncharacterized protein n=1 Tax=Eruca vesicaria subsp. sativa TaxID=29727 RepID=A0ABC8M3T6_ERUVS|nr:unnamed protein product [Eruca vesicaria subsp. sativa]
MAKNLNTISFAVLLFVLVIASTGILNSEAVDCPGGCSLASQRTFLDECGAVPFTGTDAECCTCCKGKWLSPPLCWAVVEGTEKHCHCYRHV